jgi:CubicO group peptidase (beta-lactamase class C family)
MKLRFEPVEKMCAAAVADGTVPGLVLLVASAGQVVFHQAFGSRQLVPRKLPAFADTLYDVASLTKAVVTSVLAMREVGAGRLALDARAVGVLPELAADDPARAEITVRHLLCHASGLPAHRPFWRRAAGAPSARLAVSLLAAREPLEHPPGAEAVYSDLGFILLGWLLERVTATRLDALAARDIIAPLGLGATTFLGLAEVDARARVLAERSIAATQLCAERGRVLIGEVDDLNAAAMGGIAGHAGLFSTAADLSAIARALCRAHRGEDGGGAGALVERDVVREFWSPSGVPGSTWRLGWDGPAASHSQAGARLSREAVGHLAFTGCSLWIDPARETWIVLLSNRVHPAVPTDDRFRRFRPALHDAALDAIAYR